MVLVRLMMLIIRKTLETLRLLQGQESQIQEMLRAEEIYVCLVVPSPQI